MPSINSLVLLIVYLVLAGVIIYLVQYLLGLLTLPQPIKVAILVIVSLIVLLWLINQFMPGLLTYAVLV